MRRRKRAAVLAVVALAACARDKGPTPGEVMVEVTTDLQVPGDLNSVQVVVSANGVTQLDQTSSVGPGNLALPATFGVIVGPNADPAAPVKIDIIGYRSSTGGAPLPQIVNEAIVTIPETGVVLLRMPLDYLCLDQLKPNPSVTDSGVAVDGGGATAAPYVPNCPTGQTCVAGTCAPETVPSGSLPAFNPSEIFGGGASADGGACFDVASCFASDTAVALTGGATCTFPAPSGIAASDLNVAILTSQKGEGEGICLGDGECLVALDQGLGGWSISGGTVTVPTVLCAAGASLVVSGGCASKTAATPACPGAAGALVDGGGGLDAGHKDATPRDGGSPDARMRDATLVDGSTTTTGVSDTSGTEGSSGSGSSRSSRSGSRSSGSMGSGSSGSGTETTSSHVTTGQGSSTSGATSTRTTTGPTSTESQTTPSSTTTTTSHGTSPTGTSSSDAGNTTSEASSQSSSSSDAGGGSSQTTMQSSSHQSSSSSQMTTEQSSSSASSSSSPSSSQMSCSSGGSSSSSSIIQSTGGSALSGADAP